MMVGELLGGAELGRGVVVRSEDLLAVEGGGGGGGGGGRSW